MSTKICIVGEAWGEQEARQRTPFVGPAGYQLTSLLNDSGIRRADCYLTNVFNFQPEKNDIKSLCGTKKEDTLGLPPIVPSGYLQAKYWPEVERLKAEIEGLRPNIVIAMGNIPAWALLQTTGISKIRGSTALSSLVPGQKVLATYHPSAVLRQYDLRPVTVADLEKAKRESEFPEIRRTERTVFIEPDLSDLEWFYEAHLAQAKMIFPDIETSGDQITCIGFAPSPSISMVVPFLDWRKPGFSYWPTLEAELAAWSWVKKVLAMPQPKCFHNGLYDLGFLWRHYGIPTTNPNEDSMLLSHAKQPESLKGLGFLASIYEDESAWKLMNSHSKTIKRNN